MGNRASECNSKCSEKPTSVSYQGSLIDVSSIFHSLSLRFAGVSFQSSTNHPPTFSKSRLSRRNIQKHSSDPYISSRAVWPVNLCEAPFLPEFPIRNGIDESSFNVLEIISTGGYGKVFKAVKKDDGKIYAMKVISKSQILKDNAVRQVKDEIKIHLLCGHHPFLIPGPFHWQNKKHLYIVTPYIDGGDLHQLWKNTGCFDVELTKIYVGELALAIDFLHNAGIIYRDLKLENVLLDNNGHLKLIDFGLSKWLPLGVRTYTLCGTLHYMAPEVFQPQSIGQGYTHSVDWWSLGVLLFALLEGQLPFRCMPDFCEIADIEFTAEPPCCENGRRLVHNLLTREPSKRLHSLRTLERHGFYHHFDFEALKSRTVDPLPLLQIQRQKSRPQSKESEDDDITADFDS